MEERRRKEKREKEGGKNRQCQQEYNIIEIESVENRKQNLL